MRVDGANTCSDNQETRIDFIGVGMAKSGTSWLAQVCSAHPDILFSRKRSSKEVKYFNKKYNFNKGLNWYLAQFPPAEPGKLRGEFTPMYLVDADAPKLIKDAFPNVKLIVCLRHPADVLYSLYNDWLASPWKQIDFDFSGAVREGKWDLIHAELVDYPKSLMRYYECFDRSNIRIFLFEDIQNSPGKVADELYAFLGVKNYLPKRLDQKVNVSIAPRSMLLHRALQRLIRATRGAQMSKAIEHAPIMNEIIYHGYKLINGRKLTANRLDKKTRDILTEHFSASILDLQNMLGRDLSHWLVGTK